MSRWRIHLRAIVRGHPFGESVLGKLFHRRLELPCLPQIWVQQRTGPGSKTGATCSVATNQPKMAPTRRTCYSLRSEMPTCRAARHHVTGGHLGKFIVTGAFGYSGKYIARRLLDQGHVVHTVTGSPDRENPFHGRVSASPFHFDRPENLVPALAGAQALINTYWVRFDHRDFNHSEAVNNTLTLFRAAKEAGVTRVVHISITKPTLDSELPYFKGKAELELALVESGLSYSILRPTVLFGEEDILVNNIAWVLRRFPVFTVFGDGSYRLQPIYVDDLAALAVEQAQASANTVIDAIGPETFTFKELVGAVAATIGKRRPLVSIPPSLGYFAATVIGKFVGDVFLTREEITGLMSELLCTDSTPTGVTRLTDWISQHKDTLGLRYSSELARRRDRRKSYASVNEVA